MRKFLENKTYDQRFHHSAEDKQLTYIQHTEKLKLLTSRQY